MSPAQWWLGFLEWVLISGLHVLNRSKQRKEQWWCKWFSWCAHSVQNAIDKRLKILMFQTCQLFLCLVWHLCTSLVLRKLAKLSWQGGLWSARAFQDFSWQGSILEMETGWEAGLAKQGSCKTEAKFPQNSIMLCGFFRMIRRVVCCLKN